MIFSNYILKYCHMLGEIFQVCWAIDQTVMFKGMVFEVGCNLVKPRLQQMLFGFYFLELLKHVSFFSV